MNAACRRPAHSAQARTGDSRQNTLIWTAIVTHAPSVISVQAARRAFCLTFSITQRDADLRLGAA
jgi:hypothetical protein